MTDCPEAGLIGVEPDQEALALARRKFGAGADLVKWHTGFLDSLELPAGWQPNKIVSSLVLHQVPLRTTQAILETIESLLVPSSEERRVGNVCVSTCRFRGLRYNKKTKINEHT